MHIEVERVEHLRFHHGGPVRAASAVTRFGDGFLVVQDDATHAAWFRGDRATAVRLLPPIGQLEVFDEASGTKHLKPDLEAACLIPAGDESGVLVMGSGSSPVRMRWVLLSLQEGRPRSEVTDMSPLYPIVADAMEVPPEGLNLEGACILGDQLRWFHRGLPAAGDPSASVDLDLAQVLAAARGRAGADTVSVSGARRYELGRVGDVGLAVTDAIALPGGEVLCSAAAEDSPNTTDDGPVVGSALVRLGVDDDVDVAPLPLISGAVAKVEGLMLLDSTSQPLTLLAVVDDDDPEAPSLAVRLRVRL